MEYARKSLTEQLDVLEGSYLKIKNYMIQDSVHFVDYYVGMILSLLDKVNFDLAQWPKTKKWYNEIKKKMSKNIDMFHEQ